MNGLRYKGRFVGEGDGVTLFNSMDFSTTTGGGYSPTLRAEKADAGVCVRQETKLKKNDMKRDLHREVRVVYRACRRKYGVERTQDECLRVFKLVFPERCRAVNGGDGEYVLSAKCSDGVREVFDSWHATGRLAELLGTVMAVMDKPMGKDAFVDFCDDITPVAMRIRKLTPRECFRLMGVDDVDIDKVQASGVSNSGQYKLAGNSIVVDVLYHIFRKAFVEPGPDARKGELVQLSLF